MKRQEELLQLDQVELYIVSLGSGDCPLIMIHGGPDWDHNYLLAAAEKIAETHPVILFDIRGCGRSTRYADPTKYGRDQIIDDLLGILKKKNLSRVSLLGFSFGGRIALRFAYRFPEKISRLILASTSPYSKLKAKSTDIEVQEKEQAIPTPPSLEEIFSRSDLNDEETTRMLALQSLPFFIYDKSKLKQAEDIVKKVQFSGEWAGAWRAGMLTEDNTDYAKWLPEQSFPSLIIHGRQDTHFPLADMQPLAKSPSKVKLVVIENAGHFVHIEKEKEWVGCIVDFLDKTAAGN